jgi:hypothetical protein
MVCATVDRSSDACAHAGSREERERHSENRGRCEERRCKSRCRHRGCRCEADRGRGQTSHHGEECAESRDRYCGAHAQEKSAEQKRRSSQHAADHQDTRRFHRVNDRARIARDIVCHVKRFGHRFQCLLQAVWTAFNFKTSSKSRTPGMLCARRSSLDFGGRHVPVASGAAISTNGSRT